MKTMMARILLVRQSQWLTKSYLSSSSHSSTKSLSLCFVDLQDQYVENALLGTLFFWIVSGFIPFEVA